MLTGMVVRTERDAVAVSYLAADSFPASMIDVRRLHPAIAQTETVSRTWATAQPLLELLSHLPWRPGSVLATRVDSDAHD